MSTAGPEGKFFRTLSDSDFINCDDLRLPCQVVVYDLSWCDTATLDLADPGCS